MKICMHLIGPWVRKKEEIEVERTFYLVCTKEIVNLSSQPHLCSFVLTQFESGLLSAILDIPDSA